MILANLRARFVTTDTDVVVELLSDGDPRRDQSLRDQVAREGVEVLLDNEALPERLRTSTRVFGPSPALFIYVTVRHALLSVQIDSRLLSDYLGALLFEFGRSRRAYQIARYDDESFHYLTDIVAGLESHRGRRGFLLRAHLGNFSLWMAGIFPEYIAARRRRNGGPGLEYFERLGARGYQLASDHRLAQEFDLAAVYEEAASSFSAVRVALNRVSDQLLFPHHVSPDRLMRQVADEFNQSPVD